MQMDRVSIPICEDSEDIGGAATDGFLCSTLTSLVYSWSAT